MNAKQLFTAMLLLLTLQVSAQTKKPEKSAITKVSVERFHKVIINAAIDVLLIEDNEPGTLYIEGDKTFFSEISIKQNNGVLTIDAPKDRSYKNKIYIGLPVNKLAEIEINKPSFVTTMNTLQSAELLVTLFEECLVNLKSAGRIEIRSGADISTAYLKRLPKEYRSSYSH